MIETVLINNLTVTAKITRLIDRRLQSCTCDLSMDLDFEAGFDDRVRQERLTMIRNWLDNVLDECVAFSIQSPVNTQIFGEIENHLMFCPSEPYDHMLLMLIMAKVNAIADGVLTVRSGTINVDTARGFGSTLIGDPLELLPAPDDCLGQVRYWDKPWWDRSDGGMMDMMVMQGEDPSVKPDILIDLSGKMAPRSAVADIPREDHGTDAPERSAEIIRPDFRSRARRDD